MNTRKSRGFALPTVLMASIIMLMVLVAAVTSTAAVRVALRTQYYNQLSQQASEAGVVYAKECIKANGGTPGWTDAKPLKPGTDCNGDPIAAGLDCAATPKDARCSVMVVDSNTIISFSVARPLQDSNGAFNNIQSTGGVNLLRSSDSTVWRQYSKSTKSTVVDKSFMNDFHWKEVASGEHHTCGIASDDNAYCWGLNDEGQLGNGTTVSINSPVAVVNDGALNGLKLKSIKAAGGHTCALASDSKVYCWGAQTYGRLGNGQTTGNSTAPVAVSQGDLPVGAIIQSLSTSTNSYNTCAIADNGNGYCWGANWNGQLGINVLGGTQSVPRQIYKNGSLNNQSLKTVSVGGDSSCAIAVDNKAYCWGDGSEGQMGNGTNINDNIAPVLVTLGGRTVKHISVGMHSACIVASDNNGYCWGLNSRGGIGDGTIENKSTPTQVVNTGILNGLTLKSIEVGGSHSCAIASDNNAYCWGYGSNGQLGNDDNTTSYVPVAVDRSKAFIGLIVKTIQLGEFHTCAIASDEKMYCWGYNDYGQTSIDEYLISETPKPIRVIRNNQLLLNGLSIDSIASGNHHVCAIASDSKTYCWGINDDGELGGYLVNQSSPIPTSVYTGGALNGLSFKKIIAGTYHTCGISNGNKAYCWGDNDYGKLGNNSTLGSSIPVAVVDLGLLYNKDIKDMSAGAYQTCVVASDNNAYCWGRNNYGQLGNNTNTNSRVPVAVYGGDLLLGKSVLSISAGEHHVCVIASDNNAYCWGLNNNGQLGDNTIVNKKVPTSVMNTGALSGLSIKSISSGRRHTCAIASDNNAYCWGLNDHGQLGNNSIAQSIEPVAVNRTGVLNGLYIKSISAKGDLTCAIASDDNAYCWGDNELGGLGDGTEVDYSTVPVSVVKNGILNNQTVKSIASGAYHACVVALDNKVYCWGTNHYGEHGNTIYEDSNFPEAVIYTITNPPAQSRFDFGSVYY